MLISSRHICIRSVDRVRVGSGNEIAPKRKKMEDLERYGDNLLFNTRPLGPIEQSSS